MFHIHDNIYTCLSGIQYTTEALQLQGLHSRPVAAGCHKRILVLLPASCFILYHMK